ncbi:MFS transporter [Cupriavidus sp. SK-4]|uniref:MFS transporter n=1 Tax=Cupriavidus sp. SK-4 TaxID=574750 RepID=UPI0007C6AF61|nr:MFS transporter [Cupriavidus sp. SK-4]
MRSAIGGSQATASSAAPVRLGLVVPALGIAQIASWGSLYYSFAVLSGPVQAELKVGQPVLFGAFTLALLVSALTAPRTGRAIDRFGGKRILCAGSILAALALGALAMASNVPMVYGAWILAGLAMPMALYDPAFATLHQLAPDRYRKSVSALTLFGGFASTVFWPIAAYLNAEIGWRLTLAAFAAWQLFVCLPLHALVLPALSRRSSSARPEQAATAPPAAHSDAAPAMQFHLLAGAFAVALFVFGALSVHLLNLLQLGGLSVAEAVLVASVIGPMQVTGRMMELALAGRFRPSQAGRFSLLLLCIALVLLSLSSGSVVGGIAFAAIYGLSNGLLTIVRGTLPADLFPGYPVGSLLGRLARPGLLAMAVAPLCYAVVASSGAPFAWRAVALLVLAGLALTLLIAATRTRVAEPGPASLEGN